MSTNQALGLSAKERLSPTPVRLGPADLLKQRLEIGACYFLPGH